MSRPLRSRRRRARQGFTILEVMMGLGVMMIGIVGVLALQRAVIHANYESRATAIATSNSARWSGILRRSAASWTDPSDIQSVPYLREVGNGWFIPIVNAGTKETDPHGVDWYGQPSDVTDDVRYCTLLRIREVTAGSSVRADIITFWPRQVSRGSGSGFADFTTFCVPGQADPAAQALNADDPTLPVPTVGLHVLRSTMILRRARL